MTYMIDPPDDRYSDSALEVWERHLQQLQRLIEANPNDDILKSSLSGAERTIARIRDWEKSKATGLLTGP